MSERTHALAQLLAGKETIEACSLDDLKRLVQRYPYFAPAHFLLLQKLKQEEDPEYTAQLQKAILYYPNPLSFQYFISSSRFFTDLPPDAVVQEEPAPVEQAIEEAPTAALEMIPDPAPGTVVVPSEALAVEELHDVANERDETFSEAVTPVEDISPDVTEQTETVPDVLEEQSQVRQPPADPVPSVQEVQAPSASAPAKGEITFEPFHTVDYFASQGIKLSGEEAPKDKFGKQLKSFTEWLKTMKRIPPGQVTEGMDTNTEHRVQRLAQHSIDESAVWTEAMAEVWIKQGNRQKAIDVYNKLSLLNPSKKAYFADKIQNLKRS